MTALRRLAVVVLTAALPVALPAAASAHGIGGRGDLPVPVEYFVVGAGVVLAASFAALAVLWPEPRLQDGPRVRILAIPGARVFGWVLAGTGLVGLALVISAGLFGDERRSNAAPVLVWVYFWLVIPFLAVVLGDLWRSINPWRTISRAAGIGEEERGGWVTRLGVWPATVAFVAFTWLELVWRDPARPNVISAAALVYTVYVIGFMAVAGRERGLVAGEAFTTYIGLFGSIAPIDRDDDGRVLWRGWLRALPSVTQRPGLALFVLAMLGTVTYDGLSNTEWWEERVGSLANEEWFGTVALVGSIAVLGAGYLTASWAARRIGGGDLTLAAVARSFAHTLVPIALAYAVAHYFTLVIFEGQLLFAAVSDPLGLGWDLFGTADWRISFWLSPTAIWYVQVGAIVAGHVVAVVLAHDRALALFPRARAVRSQYAMLALMVALTGLGLVLLSAG